VVDASSPVRHEQIEQVNRVLAEINALDIPQIVVMNKIDAAPELLEQGPRLERDEDGIPTRVFLSAREGMGLDALREAVVEVAQWLASRPPEPQPYDPRLADVPHYDSADDGGVADGSDDPDAGDSGRL